MSSAEVGRVGQEGGEGGASHDGCLVIMMVASLVPKALVNSASAILGIGK